MQKYNILWADDEIDLLKAHVMFLEQKGYNVTPVNSGVEALEKVDETEYDLVFLDESMPGMSGLEVLAAIKAKKPSLPVVMITKNEEESIMEEAIGSKISDYIIKPINPNQVLLSIKKILDNKRLVTEKTNSKYQQAFREISTVYNDIIDFNEWTEVYKQLVYHELEIDNTEHKSMKEVLEMQKVEANNNFCDFIADNYEDWVNGKGEAPLMSNQLLKKKVFPKINDKNPVFFILVDNLRYDQWKVIEPLLAEYYNIDEEFYYSILPTTTAYARNAIFSGMMPLDIATKHPELWVEDDEEGGKNNSEEELLKMHVVKEKINGKVSYNKIIRQDQGKTILDNYKNLMNNQFNVLVYNFVDMISHARTDMAVIKELASDESAYRSITKSWFNHSPLFELLKILANKEVKVFLTTDHGTIRVRKPHKIIGDRNTNTNLRYKQGKNLSYENKNVFVAKDPLKFKLPKQNVSQSYVFATEAYFFAYPNNYNHYVNLYADTFQHGGVSLEEVIIPFIELSPKKK